MEHFRDPWLALEQMKALLAPDGRILLAFGCPWWSPHGSHMHFFCQIPWLQLWFSERTIMGVRARYKTDGARHFTEVDGGLNKMSLRKFERLIRRAGLRADRLEYRGVKGQHWLTHVPLVREFFTTRVVSVLALNSLHNYQS